MEHLALACVKAVRSLFTPGMALIVVKSLIITIIALTFFFFAASGFFFWLFGAESPLSWLGAFGTGVIAWFLFPGIMPIIVNFFDTRIVGLIEQNDYPASPRAKEPPFFAELWHDVRFSAKAVFLNLLLLPLYLIPIVNLLVFYLLNGYLLGREFFVMVGRQHMPIEEAEALRKKNDYLVTMAGTALAINATIPIINLFAPIWGIALMTHLYHRLSGTPKMEVLPPQL